MEIAGLVLRLMWRLGTSSMVIVTSDISCVVAQPGSEQVHPAAGWQDRQGGTCAHSPEDIPDSLHSG